MRTYLFIALGLSLGLSVFLMEDSVSQHSQTSASLEMPAVRVAAGPAADRPPLNQAQRVESVSGDRWAMMPFEYLAVVAKPAAPPPRLSKSCRALFQTTEWPGIVDAVYTGVGGGLLLTENRMLTSQGQELLSMMREVESHGLSSKDYNVAALTAAKLTTEKAAEERDLRLVAAMIRYVADFKFLTKAHPMESDKDPKKVFKSKAKEIAELAISLFPKPAHGLKALWPAHPDYAAIREVIKRYKALAKLDMPLLPKGRSLRKGLKGKRIQTLKQRLKFEGFLEGEVNDEYDDLTENAVKEYQRRHYLVQDGRVGRWTQRNMNISMAQRVRQLRLSLQRWRESPGLRSGKSHYIRINLPAYVLELYRNGKKYREHRTIIGKNRLDYNRIKWEQGYINRTPLFKSHIYKIQINPVWLIPPRVRDRELSKDVTKLRRKGIRSMPNASGGTVMVQSAGKHNALGRVKFVLENTQNVYLHDTNMPWLFKDVERDYSHGCIRVENALDLARDLAEELGDFSPVRFKQKLEHGYPYPVKLKRNLHVYVDYNTTRINEKGELIFLPDIYHYDYAYFRGKLPVKWKTRYGSLALKPRQVPRIRIADFFALKKKGGVAPAVWPPAENTQRVE